VSAIANHVTAARAAVYLAIAVLLCVVTVILPAAGAFPLPESPTDFGKSVEGTVAAVTETNRITTERGAVISERVDVRLDAEGHADNIAVERTYQEGDPFLRRVAPGDRILLNAAESPGGTTYFITDQVRRLPLWTLGLAFAALVVAVGRWRGLWSLVGLAASLLVILRFIIPAILAGANPLLIAVLGALVVMATTLYLAHGVRWETTVALAGVSISLVLTGLLAAFSIGFAQLTGLATEDSATIQILSAGAIDARGLLLGGIIIGTLGVLDDVATAQAATVFELHRTDLQLASAELFQRGMNVGREHIASTVNTLVLAYAGSSLPLLLILSVQAQPLNVLLNNELVATEIVSTLVGSIGLVASVPVTTALAAYAVGRLRDSSAPPQPPGGQRTLDEADLLR